MAPRLANEGFAGDATLRSRVGDACAVVDPPTRPQRESDDRFEKSMSTDRSSGQRLRRGQDAPKAGKPQAIRAIVWTRKCPVRTPGKIDKPLWAPTFGGPAETKKARSVVASSRVPRWAGFAGSPPAAGLPRTVNWPLVQIPADRHTTTGTCVLGKITIWVNRALAQGFSCAGTRNLALESRTPQRTTWPHMPMRRLLAEAICPKQHVG